MPDDEIIEGKVTEQLDDNPTKETETDMKDSFESEDDGEKSGFEDLDQLAKEEEGEKKKEVKPEEKEEVKEEKEIEEDEDILRGKELLEAEKETPPEIKEKPEEKAEEVKVEEKKEEIKSDTDEPDPRIFSHTQESITFLESIIPEKLLPDTIKLQDGREFNIKEMLDENPELPVLIGAISDNLTRQMIHNGYLVTEDQVAQRIEKAVNDTVDRIENMLYLDKVTDVMRGGVKDAVKLYSDPKFKEFLEKQPDEIKALMKSSDAYDAVRVFKRYLKAAGIAEADKKISEIDKKKKDKKTEVDKVLKSFSKGKGKTGTPSLSPEDEIKAGFEDDDDDEVIV